MQVAEAKFRGMPVVERNISDARNLFVSRHGNHRHRQRVTQRRVNRDQTFSPARRQDSRILLDHVRLVAVVRTEVEIPFAHQVVANARHHVGMVAVAQFRH